MIKDFCLKKNEPEVQDTLVPTLPNLYGLDVRFRYFEKIMRADKDRKSIKGSAANADNEFLSEMFDFKPTREKPPLNRHGNLLFNAEKRKKEITTQSHKM